MTTQAGFLVALAEQMELNPVQATALPACVLAMAQKTGLTQMQFVHEARRNAELRTYIKEVLDLPSVRETVERVLDEKVKGS